MLDSADKDSVNIIVSEETGKPYRGKDDFGKVFRKVRKWAGIERPLTFQDLRTTALTNMGIKGATTEGIISFSGHKFYSPVLEEYVKPGRAAAQRARTKLDQDN